MRGRSGTPEDALQEHITSLWTAVGAGDHDPQRNGKHLPRRDPRQSQFLSRNSAVPAELSMIGGSAGEASPGTAGSEDPTSEKPFRSAVPGCACPQAEEGPAESAAAGTRGCVPRSECWHRPFARGAADTQAVPPEITGCGTVPPLYGKMLPCMEQCVHAGTALAAESQKPRRPSYQRIRGLPKKAVKRIAAEMEGPKGIRLFRVRAEKRRPRTQDRIRHRSPPTGPR